jgi:hypothetical protein
MKFGLFIALGLTLLCACGEEEKAQLVPLVGPLFELVSEETRGIMFSNKLVEDDKQNTFLYEYFYNGGGVSLGDINNDGDLDLFIGGRLVPGKYPFAPQSYLLMNDGVGILRT